MLDIDIFRTRKDKIVAMKFGSIIFTVILGASIIYEVLQPTVQPMQATQYVRTLLTILVACMGLSWVLHGFHPILLFKSD